MIATSHGHLADGPLRAENSPTYTQQATEQPLTASGASSGTTEISYHSTSYTVNPLTGQLEPVDSVPPEFFDFML